MFFVLVKEVLLVNNQVIKFGAGNFDRTVFSISRILTLEIVVIFEKQVHILTFGRLIRKFGHIDLFTIKLVTKINFLWKCLQTRTQLFLVLSFYSRFYCRVLGVLNEIFYGLKSKFVIPKNIKTYWKKLATVLISELTY